MKSWNTKQGLWIVPAAAGMGIYAAAAVYHSTSFEQALQLGAPALALCVIGNAASLFFQSVLTGVLLGAFGKSSKASDRLALAAGGNLAAYLPFQLGTAVKATYLRSRFGIGFVEYGITQMGLLLFSLGLGALTGYFAVGTSGPLALGFLTLFLSVAGTGVLVVAVRLPRRPWLLEVHSSLKRLRRPRIAAAVVLLTAANLACLSLRFYGACHALPPAERLTVALTLPTAAVATSFLTLTPGSLGIRELASETLTRAQTVTAGAGFAATMVDRLIQISLSLIAWLGAMAVARTNRSRIVARPAKK